MKKSIKIAVLAISSLTILTTATFAVKTSAKSEPTWRFVPGSVESGDTFKAVRHGFRKKEFTVKICGIEAPGLNEPFGSESKEALTNLLAKTEGNLKLKFHKRILGQRNTNPLIAEVYVSGGEKDHVSVARELIASGLVDKGRFAHPFPLYGICLVDKAKEELETLKALNSQAKSSKKGIYNAELEAERKQKEQAKEEVSVRDSETIEISKYRYDQMVKTIQDLKAQRDKLAREHPGYRH